MDILEDFIKKTPGINNPTDAIRYAIMNLENENSNLGISNDVQRKINALAKNMDVITEMVAGGFDALDVKAMRKAEETYIYQDAKRAVEGDIQRATTFKASHKPKTDTPKTYSSNFI